MAGADGDDVDDGGSHQAYKAYKTYRIYKVYKSYKSYSCGRQPACGMAGQRSCYLNYMPEMLLLSTYMQFCCTKKKIITK